ncbi:amidohydrolase family protein [Alteromonas oceanisediminis]|uniref:amidohydrolase family protein n=1 Tax=Alteromonas oceanisediminis TaxID=2836180 RepID=UPI001BD9DF97|nr:amidohydrolase family protein [Alteromonas oceanisediminis]MBT0588036.1 amidohydrolase family protein [Alteromonas oceanisediminis]
MKHFYQLVKATTTASLTLCFASLAFAQNVALVGATVHTLSDTGTLENATVLMADGNIEAVGEDLNVPQNYERIDVTGKVITPGLFGAFTSLGLQEVSSSAGVVDDRVKAHPVSATGAAYDASYAINPDSSLMAITRVEGFTTAASGLSDTDQLFTGQGAVISLANTTSPVLKPRAFVHTRVDNRGAAGNGDSRAALWVALDQVLNEAAGATSADLAVGADWHGLTSKADVKALKSVLAGTTPLLVTANRAADIRQVIALKQRFSSLKLVIVEGLEAWRVASELASAQIPVIINPEYNLPGGFDQMGATLANAARLHEAGVTVAIGMDTHNIRLATQHAGNAVANGLPHEVGLKAVSLNPAIIYGVSDRMGSIESGKMANIVVWSGDPLEVTEAAEQVWINGEPTEMTSRQIKLRDRYLQLNQAKTQPYVRP